MWYGLRISRKGKNNYNGIEKMTKASSSPNEHTIFTAAGKNHIILILYYIYICIYLTETVYGSRKLQRALFWRPTDRRKDIIIILSNARCCLPKLYVSADTRNEIDFFCARIYNILLIIILP